MPVPVFGQDVFQCYDFVRKNHSRFSLPSIHLVDEFPTPAARWNDSAVPVHPNNGGNMVFAGRYHCGDGSVFGTKSHTASRINADPPDKYCPSRLQERIPRCRPPPAPIGCMDSVSPALCVRALHHQSSKPPCYLNGTPCLPAPGAALQLAAE